MRCGVYVHVPFCSRKCGYCAFASVVNDKPEDHRAMCDKIIADANVLASVLKVAPKTLYIGGGTPSVLARGVLTDLIQGIRSAFFGEDAVFGEVTCEANPESATEQFIDEASAVGVTRLSVGVQSLSPKLCAVIDRYPTDLGTLERIRSNWQGALSADLISGIPGQTTDDLLADVNRLSGLGFSHISVYDLSVERGTGLARQVESGRVRIPAEGPEWGQVRQTLVSLGYARYEVSNFAQPGFESLHNLGYWRMEPFLGLGPSATSTVPLAGGMTRIVQPSRHEAFLNSHPLHGAASETLQRAEQMTEFLMLGLRTAEGVSHARFSELFGHDLEASLGGRIDSLERRGYLARLPGPDSGGPRLAATDTGMDLLDRVLAELLADLPDSHRRSHAAPQT